MYLAAVQKLDYEVTDVEYSTEYKDVLCASTFQFGNWYHNGTLHVYHLNHSDEHNPKFEKLASHDNRTGIRKINWSEHYTSTVISANDDCTVSFWDVNNGKKEATLKAHHTPVTAVNWNQLSHDFILTASDSSRIKLFDISNLEYVLTLYAEHTKSISDVKWNDNNPDEFASTSHDGLLKIWDRRSDTSVNTLLDRDDGSPLLCCDWHKRDDWTIAIGSMSSRISIWDTRNPLQPLRTRIAHRAAVNDLKYDTQDPERMLSASNDRTTRVWDTGRGGMHLTQEERVHRDGVNAVDWNLHDGERITTAGSDGTVVTNMLTGMTQVREEEEEMEEEGGGGRVIKTEKSRPVFISSRI
eukprot:gb/GECH01001027.1/.p1 GENE.gb/GECH01001027.1/~~gb/GECH01001027.1/.p1  ORF type:complete len:355 (+),score=83.26 gb/GECH01001027.1/:1-1065(+)